MNADPNSIAILIADDDADDRLMAKEALEECRLANPVEFVEDGVELLDYLRGRGRYAASAGLARRPRLDHTRPEHAEDGWTGGASGDQGGPAVAAHPGRGHDHIEGRRGHLPHLRPRRQLVHHQAGHVRRTGGRDEDNGQVLD